MDPSHYSQTLFLRDGQKLLIRAIRPSDATALREGFEKLSTASVRARFFNVKHDLSEQEVDALVRVDFVRHVALVAELDEENCAKPAGVARYIRSREPGHAELAVTVADALHGRGIGSALLKQLVRVARNAGLSYLDAYVLAENHAMLHVLRHAGLPFTQEADGATEFISLSLTGPETNNSGTSHAATPRPSKSP